MQRETKPRQRQAQAAHGEWCPISEALVHVAKAFRSEANSKVALLEAVADAKLAARWHEANGSFTEIGASEWRDGNDYVFCLDWERSRIGIKAWRLYQVLYKHRRFPEEDPYRQEMMTNIEQWIAQHHDLIARLRECRRPKSHLYLDGTLQVSRQQLQALWPLPGRQETYKDVDEEALRQAIPLAAADAR